MSAITPLGRSRPVADASREVVERWLLDGLDVSVVTGGVPVTHLRKMMLEELQLRNYAQNTIRHYIRAVEEFARHFHCSPDRLGPRHVREYQAQLFQKRKLSANSVGQHLAALRFLYIKTLRRPWSLAETPYPKKVHLLPQNGQLQFHGDLKLLAEPKVFAAWLRPLYRHDWVVYLKRPFGGPAYVVHYLGRYTHRVAISNHRLVSFTNGQVTFRWRDSAHHNQQKLL